MEWAYSYSPGAHRGRSFTDCNRCHTDCHSIESKYVHLAFCASVTMTLMTFILALDWDILQIYLQCILKIKFAFQVIQKVRTQTGHADTLFCSSGHDLDIWTWPTCTVPAYQKWKLNFLDLGFQKLEPEQTNRNTDASNQKHCHSYRF